MTLKVIEPPGEGSERIVEWEGVSLEYEGKAVLRQITGHILDKELTCLCGSNGAGKTQLVRLALGFNAPTVGTVKLLGAAPGKFRRQVGYVPQLKAFNRNFPATVEDVLVASWRGAWPLFSRKGERDKAAQILDSVGGLSLLDKDIAVLSGGELQRVFMAKALIKSPRLLVLDEPLAAIDTKGRSRLMDLMDELRASRNMAILLITHSEPVVRRLADRVMFIDHGELVGWGAAGKMLSIESMRDVAFFGHDHESVIHGEEG